MEAFSSLMRGEGTKRRCYLFNRLTVEEVGFFPFLPPPPPSLVGAYYLQPQAHVAYFYIMFYYVMARVSGGTNGKDPRSFLHVAFTVYL